MKRSLYLSGAVGAALLLTVVSTSIRQQLRMGRITEPLHIADMLTRAGLAEHDLPSSTKEWARQLASTLDEMDDSLSDPQVQVMFGSRTFDAASDKYAIHWGGTPRNVVKVIAQSGEPVALDSNAIVPVVFKGVFGRDGSLLRAEAIAYIDAPGLAHVGDKSEQDPQSASRAQP
jgi:hypothetical protein